MSKIKENLANNIAELRKINNMTQSELAEKLNYTDKAISKWERGESTPDIESLSAISEIFGLTIDHLLNEGNTFITADLLSLKMSLDVKEIDKVLPMIYIPNGTKEMVLKEALRRLG